MNRHNQNRIVIMGATSGLGRRLALRYIEAGWTAGLAGRNIGRLEELQSVAPDRVEIERIDITCDDAVERLGILIEKIGGMNVYLHCSGILTDEDELTEDSQSRVIATNTMGFAVMTSAAYRYFRDNNGSIADRRQIAAITSIAGIRGLAELPGYSASKAFDIHYLEALRQRADARGLSLAVTDIRPGWTRTPLLSSGRRYLLEMDEKRVADLIYRAIERKSGNVVIGMRWKVLTTLQRMLPAGIWKKIHLPLWRDK